ncbi:hypothetical protein AB3M83_05000 [Microbacterium sp. 179-B 1A2 NHS]|uniref:hypothetical protein n=1 Tax=Microbacterium sp. 179-B 1A2 NHS TaxID=3142383 RepID=UPI0039A0D904
MATIEPPRRGRGSRAGLDREQIIAAARGLDPATLTMQQVAAALGVDRKALNHHVTDRDSLLELLAVDAFRRRFAAADFDLGASWQDACRGYARALVASVRDTGAWIGYLRFVGPRDLAVVGPAETVAERMLRAGFDAVTVSRSMHLLVSVCQGFARDAIMAGRAHGHPQIEHLRSAFAASDDEYRALRDLVDLRVDNYGDDQLEFDLDAFIAGVEAMR